RARNLSAVVLLEFVKITREEANNRIECFLFVFAAGNNAQISAATGSKRQNAENRLRVSFRTAVETFQLETAFELTRHAYEVGSGACVKTETTGGLDSTFGHNQSAPLLGGVASKAPAR